MHWLSLQAPQQPMNPIADITRPKMSRTIHSQKKIWESVGELKTPFRFAVKPSPARITRANPANCVYQNKHLLNSYSIYFLQIIILYRSQKVDDKDEIFQYSAAAIQTSHLERKIDEAHPFFNSFFSKNFALLPSTGDKGLRLARSCCLCSC